MPIRTAPKRPMILAIWLFDRQIIDGRKPPPHQTVFVKLPILVAVRAKPGFGIVMPFVSETDGDAIFMKRPELFDQTVIEFLRPLTSQKLDNFFPATRKLGPISPLRVDRVSKRDFVRVARIPGIFRQSDLLNSSLHSEWR